MNTSDEIFCDKTGFKKKMQNYTAPMFFTLNKMLNHDTSTADEYLRNEIKAKEF